MFLRDFYNLFCYRREEFMHWVEMLPDTQTPSWLGLPSNAEKVLLTTQGTPQSIISSEQDQNSSLSFSPLSISKDFMLRVNH